MRRWIEMARARAPYVWQGLLRPGREMMLRRGLEAKLGLLAWGLALPVMLAILVLVQSVVEWRQHRLERQGVQAAQTWMHLAGDAQRLALLLARGGGQGPELQVLRQRVQEQSARLDLIVHQIGGRDSPAAWSAAREQLQALARADKPASSTELRDRSAALGAAAPRLMEALGRDSRLFVDDTADTRSLVDVALRRVPRLIDATAGVSIQGALLDGNDAAGSADRMRIVSGLTSVQQAHVAVQEDLDQLFHAGVAVPGAWAGVQQVARRMASAVAQTAEAGAQSADEALVLVGAAKIDALLRLGDEVVDQLDQRLGDRARSSLLMASVVLLLTGLGLAASVYLAAAFAASISASIESLRKATEQLAEGSLTGHFEVAGDDELALVGRDLERTTEMLSSLVAEIRTCAVRVDQAGADVARDGQVIAQSSDGLAIGLHTTGDASRLLGRALAEERERLDAARSRTADLGTDGTACDDVMQRSVQAVAELEQSIRRVAEVNAMIDEIAFQTNLLSINASVEAARAGETGKGFGVVAAEVRALSQRCASAAAEVRELIDRTAEQSAHARDHVNQAHRLVAHLVSGVGWVQGELEHIGSAADEQQRQLDNLMVGVATLEELGHGQSHAFAATLTASVSLGEQAQALRNTVGSMRLRQGSADEAKALVDRAQRRITEVGWERASREFHQSGGNFIDRDMFIFAVDHEDRYVVLGPYPEAVGHEVKELPFMTESMGRDYLRKARAAAAAGGGWIDYQIVAPGGLLALDKTAYVADLGDGGFIGCGVVRQNAVLPRHGEGEAALARAGVLAAVDDDRPYDVYEASTDGASSFGDGDAPVADAGSSWGAEAPAIAETGEAAPADAAETDAQAGLQPEPADALASTTADEPDHGQAVASDEAGNDVVAAKASPASDRRTAENVPA